MALKSLLRVPCIIGKLCHHEITEIESYTIYVCISKGKCMMTPNSCLSIIWNYTYLTCVTKLEGNAKNVGLVLV